MTRLLSRTRRGLRLAASLALALGLVLQTAALGAAPASARPAWLAEAICGPGASLPSGLAGAHDHLQCCALPATAPPSATVPAPEGRVGRIDPPAPGPAAAGRATPPSRARDPPSRS